MTKILLGSLKIITYILLLGMASFSAQASTAPTTLVDPEWEFFDDFEGSVDNSFWAGNGTWVNYGVNRPEANSKVMEMTYTPQSVNQTTYPGHAWSEYDFFLGINAVQVEVSFKLFTPSNYVPFSGNHKFLYLYSGPYGTAAGNVVVSAEAYGMPWGSPLGSTPFVNVGLDGNNYGWASNQEGTGSLLFETNAGSWSTYQIFFELAIEAGDFGFYEIYKDGELVISTDHDLRMTWDWRNLPSNEMLAYSQRGNFLDKGTLLGWANGDDPDGTFNYDTKFLIDDFRIRANSVHGEVQNNGVLDLIFMDGFDQSF